MNIQEKIKKKSQELLLKAETLPNIVIQWEKPITIKCANLNFKSDLNSMMHSFENFTNKPSIYYFEITSNQSGVEIRDALKFFKDENSRSCPKIDKRDAKTRILYCGSKKEKLHERFLQHLGFGSESTYALHLSYWAKDLNLDLKFHYSWLDEKFRDFTELIESALSEEAKPLVGKMP